MVDAAMCNVLTPCSLCSGQASLVVWVTDRTLASIDCTEEERGEKRGSQGGVCVEGRGEVRV